MTDERTAPPEEDAGPTPTRAEAANERLRKAEAELDKEFPEAYVHLIWGIKLAGVIKGLKWLGVPASLVLEAQADQAEKLLHQLRGNKE